jgi:hypothetical protein
MSNVEVALKEESNRLAWLISGLDEAKKIGGGKFGAAGEDIMGKIDELRGEYSEQMFVIDTALKILK